MTDGWTAQRIASIIDNATKFPIDDLDRAAQAVAEWLEEYERRVSETAFDIGVSIGWGHPESTLSEARSFNPYRKDTNA